MKTNGVVRRLAASPLGFERWEAKCLLCAWRSRERMYASKSAAVLGIGMHLSIIHKLNLKKRRVEEREPRAVKALLGSGTRFTPEKSSQ